MRFTEEFLYKIGKNFKTKNIFITGDFANVEDDINETLEADNYEDQLNPLDVSPVNFHYLNKKIKLHSLIHTGQRTNCYGKLCETKIYRFLWYRQTGTTHFCHLCLSTS